MPHLFMSQKTKQPVEKVLVELARVYEFGCS